MRIGHLTVVVIELILSLSLSVSRARANRPADKQHLTRFLADASPRTNYVPSILSDGSTDESRYTVDREGGGGEGRRGKILDKQF